MKINELRKVAEFYKALGDESRLLIVQMLAEQEMCVCEIIDKLSMSQPAVSHHLKILKQANLVNDAREGKWIYYSLNKDVFAAIFSNEESDILKFFAEPLKYKLDHIKSSQVRTEPKLCEKLTVKQNQAQK